jgi:beta-phosphoglucomutase-like phosphatase (HAD superfamily)
VIEDAGAGVEAALNAGMRVVGVGPAQYDTRAHYCVPNLENADVDMILG